jgi:putative ABC transport system permease protein
MTLGAKPGNVLGMLLSRGLMLATGGILTGLVVAGAFSRLLRSFLFQVSPVDPVVFLTVSVLLIIVSLLAIYIRARRAMRIDPAIALRYE